MNRLTLVEDLGMMPHWKNGKKIRKGLFLCECGNTKILPITIVKCNYTKSCGCLARDNLIKRNYKHGLSRTGLSNTWYKMIERCNDKNNAGYKDYGGRGITVCDEWSNDFVCFYNWGISNGWKKHLQIDRINNDGNYEPNNCRFVTSAENCAVGRRRKNKSNTSNYTGVSYHINQKTFNAKFKEKHIGSFKTLEEAVEARIAKEIEVFGEQKTNFHYKGDKI